MPHSTVDYSDALTEAFDRQAFALALHPLVADIATTKVDACKTRFRRVDEAVIADGSPGHALIHIELALLPGRTPETKSALTAAVLDLVRRHTAATPGLSVATSVDVSDLGPAYVRHLEP
jgi:5-carboxymethyl-2-hydroxymuconate isomerase